MTTSQEQLIRLERRVADLEERIDRVITSGQYTILAMRSMTEAISDLEERTRDKEDH